MGQHKIVMLGVGSKEDCMCVGSDIKGIDAQYMGLTRIT